MSARAPNFSVSVDVANPGQFFACCGLLELADRLWAGAEGWFDDQAFCLITGDVSHSLAALLDEVRLITFNVASCLEGDKGEEDNDKGPVDPIVLFWKDGRQAIHVDWWSDKSIKPWAGSMNERVILRAMLSAIDPSNSDPFNDLRRVQYQSPKLTESGRSSKPKKKEPFYFDPRRGNKAHPLDCGFSPDTHGMEADCCPALEALCFVGLQRARPGPTRMTNQSRYSVWPRLDSTSPGLMPSLVAPVVCGSVRIPGSSDYAFHNYFRTDQRKHKTYSQATLIKTRQQ
ncbi:MAG: type I-U CRISPR-associated protein Cas8c [Deltaproteobacteria bacterium]|nr:type I-U CRISPR-associated protein Cas8c [Deltaproteobacteria bacterium]